MNADEEIKKRVENQIIKVLDLPNDISIKYIKHYMTDSIGKPDIVKFTRSTGPHKDA